MEKSPKELKIISYKSNEEFIQCTDDKEADVFGDLSETSNKKIEHHDTIKEFHFAPGELKTIKIMFLLVGACGFINWPTTTNCIQTVFATVFNNPSAANTMLIPYLFGTVSIGVVRLFFKNISLWVCELGIALLFATNIAIPLTVNFAPISLGPVLMHIIILFTGFGVSCLQGPFASYALLMPYNFTGLIIAGAGFIGLYAFLLWQLLVRVFFDSSVVEEIRIAVWVYYGCNVLGIIILLCSYLYLLKKFWFKASIENFQKSKHIKISSEKDTPNTSTKKVSADMPNLQATGIRDTWTMLKKPLPLMIMSGISFTLVYTTFPNIGPYGWSTTYDNRSLLVGIYQFIDMIGRYAPNLGKNFIISTKLVIILLVFRLLFIPLFLIMAIYDTTLTSNLILQLCLMIPFAVLAGYLSVVPVLGIGSHLVSVAERGYLGMIYFVFGQSYLLIGLALSNLLIYIFGISY